MKGKNIIQFKIYFKILIVLSSATLTLADIGIQFDIDITKDQHPISPYIYGSNTDSLTADDGITFRRSGGNRLTGYNWENNASNAGTDYFNNSDNYLGGGSIPAKVLTDFHTHASAMGAASIITIPAAGFVAKDKSGMVLPGQVAPSARWAQIVYNKPKAFSLIPDTSDSFIYTDECINFLVQKLGNAKNNGIPFYNIDNEPGIWSSTHPLLHPLPVSPNELVEKTAGTALAIKKIDPDAQIFGGVFYGYNDFYSLQDAAGWNAIKSAGKYSWYFDYFLEQMKKASDLAGKRLLDVVDLHWYPEARGDNRIIEANANTEKDQIARLQAPRSLWDSNYVESSWITSSLTQKPSASNPNQLVPGPINLLPRLFASIDKYYPGTKLSLTEYNFGGENQFTGTLAVADFLGIMGRAGVFASSFWPMTANPISMKSAIKLYRNYDGKKNTFGSTSVLAKSSDDENASIYASLDDQGKELHIVLLNKNLTQNITGNFHITTPIAITDGRIFSMSAISSSGLTEKLAINGITANSFSYTLPPQTMSHFILKGAGPLALFPAKFKTANPKNKSGIHWTQERSTNLAFIKDAKILLINGKTKPKLKAKLDANLETNKTK